MDIFHTHYSVDFSMLLHFLNSIFFNIKNCCNVKRNLSFPAKRIKKYIIIVYKH
jgi:hypothetical protein